MMLSSANMAVSGHDEVVAANMGGSDSNESIWDGAMDTSHETLQIILDSGEESGNESPNDGTGVTLECVTCVACLACVTCVE